MKLKTETILKMLQEELTPAFENEDFFQVRKIAREFQSKWVNESSSMRDYLNVRYQVYFIGNRIYTVRK